MTRKRVIHGLLALALMASVLATTIGCGPPVTGSGKLETREMDHSNFTKLDAGYAFRVEITRADSFFVSVTLDDNLFDYLDVSQTGSTLRIRLKSGYSYLHTTQKATVTMPDLRGLNLSGASRGDVSGFSSTDSLDIDLSGASSLDIDGVTAGNTDFDISGASRAYGSIEIADGDFNVSGASTVELEGTATDVTMDVSGASTMKLRDFAVEDADIELSGASSATINASGILDINVSGASGLTYTGNPTLDDIEVTGASTIRKE